MGFDNISFASLPLIDLTTVDQPKQRMATEAVDMLLSRIENPDQPLSSVIVPASLILRHSCRKIVE